MRDLPPGLAASLASGVTTSCRCWRLERRDGTVLGFTDHDEDVTFDGVTYEAAAGMSPAEFRQSSTLAVDTWEVAGALQSDRLTEADLAAGLWDHARLAIYLVDWTNVADRIVLFAGSIGEVSRGRTAFRAEMRGLSHALNQERGRIYQRACDADLGDSRCGIDLDQPQFKGSGTVDGVADDHTFSATGLAAFASGWFSRGKLTWTSGANTGHAMEVKAHANSGGSAAFELWERMPFAIAVGDTFTVTAGCDKSLATCRDRFDNVVNFRGFPFIPGNDALVSYPNRGEQNDGGSRGLAG